MQIRVGFEMAYPCPQPTPMILVLNVHPSRAADLLQPDTLLTQPPVPVTSHRDLFGNTCSRLVAAQGRFVVSADARIRDAGLADIVDPQAAQTPVERLPEATLV